MGDYTDMILEGLLDEETGEYQGDINKEMFGEDSPGFPLSHERNAREAAATKFNCHHCNKRVKVTGLQMHIRVVHG